MFNRVLVPLDGSRYSARALPYALEIAKRFSSEVMLLQVIHPAPVNIPTVAGDAMINTQAIEAVERSAQAQDRRDVAKAGRYLRTRTEKMQGIRSSFHVELGEPAETIIKFSRKEAVDLVVMTTSGKSGLKRAFLGSVADKVIREPGIPVLAVRPGKRPSKKSKAMKRQ